MEVILPYVPLHVHSINSPGSGMMTPSEIVERAAFIGMEAAALTDRWTTYGHHEFGMRAIAGGIKPVYGAEIAHRSLTGHGGEYHLTLLAKNEAGYSNLCRLVSLHHGGRETPHVTPDELEAHRGGLICLTGCIRGEANQAVLHGNLGRMREAVEALLEIFGEEDLYLELMNHGGEKENLVLDKTLPLSERLGLRAVVTNNDRFAMREDSVYYEMLGMLYGEPVSIEEGTVAEFHMKREKELEPYFYFISEALERTMEIADRCSVDLGGREPLSFTGDPDPDSTLADMCRRRFLMHYRDAHPDNGRDREGRLSLELASAGEEGLAGYLLFVSRLFQAARSRGLWMEVAGGELAESLAAFLLGIVAIDPVEHGLVFESFGAVREGVPPVLDMMKASGEREKLLSMLREMLPGCRLCYQLGREESSFQSLVRELCAPAGLGSEEASRLVEALPQYGRRSSLAEMLEGSDRLSRIYGESRRARKVLHSAAALRGRVCQFVRNSSRIVMLPRDGDRQVFAFAGDGGEEYVMADSEAVPAMGGWILGVQHSHFLSALSRALVIILGDGKAEIDEDGRSALADGAWVPDDLDDRITYDMIRSGDTTGVYLLESRGVRDLVTRVGPGSFEELVNTISLYRPAPLEGKLWQRYVENAEKAGSMTAVHPSLSPALESTRGLLLYREQVREILLESAGLSGGDAVLVEKALRKRHPEDLSPARLMFIRGAIENDIDEEQAQKLFDYLLHNIGYTYDKAFSSTQALISYRTAFLKANFPAQYFAALLESTRDVRERHSRYLDHLSGSGPEVYPPDINVSGEAFQPEGNGIRAPLGHSCDLTGRELEVLVEERSSRGEFESLGDFLDRLAGDVSMETVIDMIGCGLFDDIAEDRDAMEKEALGFYEKHGRAGDFFRSSGGSAGKARKARERGQMTLFEDSDE